MPNALNGVLFVGGTRMVENEAFKWGAMGGFLGAYCISRMKTLTLQTVSGFPPSIDHQGV